MNNDELQLNHTYLLRYRFSDILSSVTVLKITSTAYLLQWNNGLTSNNTWNEKTYIHDKYKVIEDISDFMLENFDYNQLHKDYDINNKFLQVKTTLVTCLNCGGSGSVPDNQSTAGSKTCPICLGAKMIPRVTEIS